MKLDFFDDIEGMIFHEREASLAPVNTDRNSNMNDSSQMYPENMTLAMAYVPFQQWGETYDDDKALSRGTLFPPLDLPFTGGGNKK
ncbi:spore coat associated protein CotJA [Ruminococcus sp.]|uniref:spore coat associated protein CotJA n=1 Tax=Ruminococcus sp. TaxID=41978 RepID=UPI0025E830D2|nr:spore coat associated protein CotJA [Ruminococcus sp.]